MTTDLGGEVRLGSMLFTLVEPHRGHEVAYNRWYERDHFYAGCMVGPWLFAGRRFVATRELKDLRAGTDLDLFGGAALGSYVAIYWILDGRHDDHVDWALRQVHWLHEHGRMFADRDHIHTLMYRYAWTAGEGDAGVPAELALDHPFGGLTASLIRPAPGVSADDLRSVVQTVTRPELTIGFTPIPLPADAPVTQQGLDRLDGCVMSLAFHDGPASTHRREWQEEHRVFTEVLADREVGEVLWSSPFIPTVPGTDRYVNELW